MVITVSIQDKRGEFSRMLEYYEDPQNPSEDFNTLMRAEVGERITLGLMDLETERVLPVSFRIIGTNTNEFGVRDQLWLAELMH